MPVPSTEAGKPPTGTVMVSRMPARSRRSRSTSAKRSRWAHASQPFAASIRPPRGSSRRSATRGFGPRIHTTHSFAPPSEAAAFASTRSRREPVSSSAGGHNRARGRLRLPIRAAECSRARFRSESRVSRATSAWLTRSVLSTGRARESARSPPRRGSSACGPSALGSFDARRTCAGDHPPQTGRVQSCSRVRTDMRACRTELAGICAHCHLPRESPARRVSGRRVAPTSCVCAASAQRAALTARLATPRPHALAANIVRPVRASRGLSTSAHAARRGCVPNPTRAPAGDAYRGRTWARRAAPSSRASAASATPGCAASPPMARAAPPEGPAHECVTPHRSAPGTRRTESSARGHPCPAKNARAGARRRRDARARYPACEPASRLAAFERYASRACSRPGPRPRPRKRPAPTRACRWALGARPPLGIRTRESSSRARGAGRRAWCTRSFARLRGRAGPRRGRRCS